MYDLYDIVTWHGVAWRDMERRGTAYGTWPVAHGVAWHGVAWRGVAWHGMVGVAYIYIYARRGMAWRGMAWHGVA